MFVGHEIIRNDEQSQSRKLTATINTSNTKVKACKMKLLELLIA